MDEQNVTIPAVTRQPNAFTSDRLVVSRNDKTAAPAGAISSAASSRRSDRTAARAAASSRSSLRISSSRVAIRAFAIAGVTVIDSAAPASRLARPGNRRTGARNPSAQQSGDRSARRAMAP